MVGLKKDREAHLLNWILHHRSSVVAAIAALLLSWEIKYTKSPKYLKA